MDAERFEALLAAVGELSASLNVAEVSARLLDGVVELGGAAGAALLLDAHNGAAVEPLLRGETRGEPAQVFVLRARGERVGELRVFASAPLDGRALDALVANGASALANARAHEAALLRADYDSLTGLANRGRITAALDRELERAQRYGRSLAFVIFDIDNLKGWNDRFGHLAGDAALVQVGALLRERSRLSDTAGRYGGDELALVLPETTTDGALAVAEKVRAAVEALAHADEGASLAISAGVASAPADGKTVVDLIRTADARLYRAKAAGGNRVIA